MTDTEQPVRNLCTATTPTGDRCGQTIPAGASLCLWHDESRSEEATAARRRGREGQAARLEERKAASSRTVAPEDLPGPLETLEDCVRWSAWCARSVASGVLDKFSSHETILAIGSLRQSLKERDYVAELRELRAELARYKKAGSR